MRLDKRGNVEVDTISSIELNMKLIKYKIEAKSVVLFSFARIYQLYIFPALKYKSEILFYSSCFLLSSEDSSNLINSTGSPRLFLCAKTNERKERRFYCSFFYVES